MVVNSHSYALSPWKLNAGDVYEWLIHSWRFLLVHGELMVDVLGAVITSVALIAVHLIQIRSKTLPIGQNYHTPGKA